MAKKKTKAGPVLLKHLTAADILEQWDHFLESPIGDCFEPVPAETLEPLLLCYLKWASAEQVQAFRMVLPTAIVRVEWPEAVERNYTHRLRARAAAMTGRRSRVPEPVPEQGLRFAFSKQAVVGLLTVGGVADPDKYIRGLKTCKVLQLMADPEGAIPGALAVTHTRADFAVCRKEPQAEWFPPLPADGGQQNPQSVQTHAGKEEQLL